MFQKRHYEWLARWAGENLDARQCKALSGALNTSNENFQANVFIRACETARERASSRIYGERVS